MASTQDTPNTQITPGALDRSDPERPAAAASDLVTRRSRRWAIGLSVWLLGLAALTLVMRLALPSDGLQLFDPAGGIVHGKITFDEPNPVDGIRTNDVLLAINGVPANDLIGTLTNHVVRAGDVLTYRVQTGNVVRDVAVTVRGHLNLGDSLKTQWSGWVVYLGVFVLAAWLVRRRPDVMAGHAFLLFAAGWASQSLLLQAEPLGLWTRPWLRFLSILDMSGYVVSALATLLFALAFPRPVGLLRRRPVAAVLVVPVVLISWYAIALTFGHARPTTSDIANTVAEIVWQSATLSTVVVLIVRWFKQRHDAAARRRMQIVALGVGGLFGMILVVKWLGLHPAGWTYPFVLAFFPIAIFVSIVKRDLYELDIALNRSLVAVMSTVFLLGIYLAAVGLAVRLTGNHGPLTALPAAGLVAVALAPVRSRAQRFIDERLFGIGGDPRLVFHRLGVRLAGSDDPDSLMAAVVDTAAESLRLPYAAVQLHAGEGWQTIEERGRRPGGADGIETIDMTSGGEVVGRLVVAPRHDAKTLSPVDRDLLADLALHSGVAAQVAALLTELRTAQQRLLVAREAERHRIHCDLHDGVGPTLVGLTLQLEVAAELAGSGPLADLLTRLHGAAARATQDVRGLVRALRPADLDELGLPAAIAAAAARLDAPSAPRFDLQGPGRLPELSAEVEDAAYKICLEAMSNAVRHSGANVCVVQLNQIENSSLGIEIRDDGRGFCDDVRRGTGLASMRERAEAVGGRLVVESAPGRGTRIEVALPAASDGLAVESDVVR